MFLGMRSVFLLPVTVEGVMSLTSVLFLRVGVSEPFSRLCDCVRSPFVHGFGFQGMRFLSSLGFYVQNVMSSELLWLVDSMEMKLLRYLPSVPRVNCLSHFGVWILG